MKEPGMPDHGILATFTSKPRFTRLAGGSDGSERSTMHPTPVRSRSGRLVPDFRGPPVAFRSIHYRSGPRRSDTLHYERCVGVGSVRRRRATAQPSHRSAAAGTVAAVSDVTIGGRATLLYVVVQNDAARYGYLCRV